MPGKYSLASLKFQKLFPPALLKAKCDIHLHKPILNFRHLTFRLDNCILKSLHTRSSVTMRRRKQAHIFLEAEIPWVQLGISTFCRMRPTRLGMYTKREKGRSLCLKSSEKKSVLWSNLWCPPYSAASVSSTILNFPGNVVPTR